MTDSSSASAASATAASASASAAVPCLNPRMTPIRCSVVTRSTALYSLQTATGRAGSKPLGSSRFADHAACAGCPCNRCCECETHVKARELEAAMQAALARRDDDEAETRPAKRVCSLSRLSVVTDPDVVVTKSDLRARFLLDETKVGSGTFSSVYRARVRDHPLNEDIQTLVPEDGYVAIKRFLTHSHPRRLEAEEEYLFRFGDLRHHILPLLGTHHQLGAPPALVLPYCRHQDFREHYRNMSLAMVQTYLAGLLKALRHLHRFRIIHRDVKPDNYLFDFEAARAREATSSPSTLDGSSDGALGFLVDFGLAHTEMQLKSELLRDHRLPSHVGSDLIEPQQQAADEADSVTSEMVGHDRMETESCSSSVVEAPMTPHSGASVARTSHGRNTDQPRELCSPSPPASVVISTSRRSPRKVAPSLKAREAQRTLSRETRDRLPLRPIHPRAGTRGYRAPETLAYSQQQSVAVDVWSVGATLLSILSHKYPFFSCPQDETGLAEILHVLDDRRGTVVVDIAGQRVTYELNYTPPFDLESYCRTTSGVTWPDELFTLVRGLLEVDPAKRLTAAQALEHDFFLRDHTGTKLQRTSTAKPSTHASSKKHAVAAAPAAASAR